MDIFGLEKEGAEATPDDQVLVAPLGLASFSLAPGETLVADVVIQNKGIGHSFIPEQRDFYEAWVDFAVKDGAGKTLAGFLLTQLGHLPDAGESVEYKGRRLVVAEMAGRRIARVRVETIAPEPLTSTNNQQPATNNRS